MKHRPQHEYKYKDARLKVIFSILVILALYGCSCIVDKLLLKLV
jgi:hypothetical protein